MNLSVSGEASIAGRGGRQATPHLPGYALLSPALVLMAGMLVAPVAALVILSFWTQTGFDIDRTFTLANYWQADRAVLRADRLDGDFLSRSNIRSRRS